MSKAHKLALARGRDEGRKVRNYLDALEATKPRRGRRRTPETIGARLVRIEADLDTAASLRRLQLTQEWMDLQAELASIDDAIDPSTLEAEFIEVAKAYGDRKGISYAAWRANGVSPALLKQAGIGRAG